MKQNLFLLNLLCFFMLLAGCSKKDPTPGILSSGGSSASLPGKWQVVKDSIVVKNFAFSDGTIPIPGIYYGTPNDYYDFQANGNVTIYEGGPVGTTPYQLISNTELLISGFQWGNVTLTTFTSTNLTWEKAMTSSNGGTYYRRTYLKK
ncbi:hypothetical protein [Ferruginibacter sp.]